MTQSIDQALVTQFSDQVYIQAQQKEFRLKPIVDMVQVTGKDYAVERLDTVEAIEITSRHADTIAQDITHSRRQLAMREYRTTILLDDFDDESTLIDPARGYTTAIANAMNRQIDRLCAAAAFANVNTGRNFGTSVSFANDDGITIAAGATGLTYDKLVTIQENFINADVGVDENEDLYLAITGQQHTNMLGETKLTSGDFDRNYHSEKGNIVRAVGQNVIKFSGTSGLPVISKSGSDREVIAACKGAIVFGVSKQMELTVNRRADKNNSLQLQACMFIGAVRRDGRKIQKVLCTEA